MNTSDYDEDEVLERYLVNNFPHLMTEFERRALSLAMKREKAEHGGAAGDRLRKWIARESDEVVNASRMGPQAIRQRIRQRILHDFQQGELEINRCPSCHRIVRTPLAKQCLWCGSDWHKAS